jgi:hypothetical protein
MDEVLVLRVLNGSEKFVEVSGNFLQSGFGLSLPMYAAIAGSGQSVRELGWQGIRELRMESGRGQLPGQLVRMIKFLQRHGMDVPGLFGSGNKPSAPLELYIRECLDLGTEWSEAVLMGQDTAKLKHGDGPAVSDDVLVPAMNASLAKPNDKATAVHSMCSCLLTFLAEIEDGLVPVRFLVRVTTEGLSTVEAAMVVIRQLPEVNAGAFFYVVQYLREVLSNYLYSDQLSVDKLG